MKSFKSIIGLAFLLFLILNISCSKQPIILDKYDKTEYESASFEFHKGKVDVDLFDTSLTDSTDFKIIDISSSEFEYLLKNFKRKSKNCNPNIAANFNSDDLFMASNKAQVEINFNYNKTNPSIEKTFVIHSEGGVCILRYSLKLTK